MSFEQFGKKISESQDRELERRDELIDDIGSVKARLFSDDGVNSLNYKTVRPPGSSKYIFKMASLAFVAVTVVLVMTFVSLNSNIMYNSKNSTGVKSDENSNKNSDDKSIAGTVLVQDGWIATKASESRVLKFRDNSLITLLGETRGRILKDQKHSVHFLLESGSCKISVVHHDDTEWHIDAGPYSVKVVGTVFAVSWNPRSGEFLVDMDRGRIFVRGPMLKGGRYVESNEILLAETMKKRFKISSKSVEDTDLMSDTGISAKDKITIQNSKKERNKLNSSHVKSSTVLKSEKINLPVKERKTWSKLAESGKFSQIVSEAISEGVKESFETRSIDELMALGDAARLLGNWKLAFSTYKGVRVRYKGSSQASLCAYLMGKIAFDNQHLYSRSAKLLKIYLNEAGQSDSLAREALGRLFEAEHRSGNSSKSKITAKKYLSLYPDGPQAALATSILAESD